MTKLGNTRDVAGLRRKMRMNSVWGLLIFTDVPRIATDI